MIRNNECNNAFKLHQIIFFELLSTALASMNIDNDDPRWYKTVSCIESEQMTSLLSDSLLLLLAARST